MGAMDWSFIQIHQVAWVIAGICAFGSVSLAGFIIYKHLFNYTEPRIQIFIVRIILMIPIYTIDSYLSLIFKDYALYFDLGRDCYEAYVLYMFFRLLVEFANGEEAMIAQLEQKRQIRYSAPLCCFHIKPGRIFMHRCKQMILQYVIFKPLLSISSFVLQLFHEYEEGDYSIHSGYLYIAIVYNVSITISLYFLVLFYEATKDILAAYKPLSKFLCIKAIIFFSFWQGIVISGMSSFGILIVAKDDWTVDNVAKGVQAFLICVEMLPLSFAFYKTFGYQNFKDPLASVFYNDSRTVFSNFASVANVRDVVDDTIVSLKKGPKRNVIVGDFLKLPMDIQLRRVLKQGWISKRGEDLAKLWKIRYVAVIREPKGIVYFKYNPWERAKNGAFPEMKARGYISADQINDVRLKEENRVIVATPYRNWHFKFASPQEREEWMVVLNKLVPEDSQRPVVPLEV